MKKALRHEFYRQIQGALCIIAAGALVAVFWGGCEYASDGPSENESTPFATTEVLFQEAQSLMHHSAAGMKPELLLEDLVRRFERNGHIDSVDNVEVLVAYAAVLNAKGKTTQAQEILEKALEESGHIPPLDPKRKAALLFRLATVTAKNDHVDTAINLFDQAVQYYDPRDNADRRSIEMVLAMEKSLFKRKGEFEAALRSAIDAAKTTNGPEHISVGRGLYQLGLYLEEEGAFVEAQKAFTESLTIHERILGTDHPALVTFYTHLASLLRKQGKYAEAVSYLGKALSTTNRLAEQDNPFLQQALRKMSLSIRQETEIEIRLTIDEDTARFGPDHPRTINAIRYYAMFLQSAGRFHEAEQSLKRVLALYEKNPEKDPGEHARTLLQLAECYQATGSGSEALVLARQALEIMEQRFGTGHPKTMPFAYNLALFLEKNKQYSAAKDLFEHAYLFYSGILEPDHDFLASLAKHIAEIYYVQGKTPPPLTSGDRSAAGSDAEERSSEPCLLERRGYAAFPDSHKRRP